MKWKRIYRFFEFLDAFRQIERIIYVDREKNKENDVEHSYQLAMMGWYIAQTENLDMNMDRIIRYALVHDLVEVHAGDTLPFTRGQDGDVLKQANEAAALERIKREFHEFPELTQWIELYEHKRDEESRFVYALDKMIATMNNYHSKGLLWKDYGITLDEVIDYSLGKAEADPTIHTIYKEFVVELRKEFGGENL